VGKRIAAAATFFTQPRSQHRWNLAVLAAPPKWAGLGMIGRKGAFFESLEQEEASQTERGSTKENR